MIVTHLLTVAERSGTNGVESVLILTYSAKNKFQEKPKSIVDPNWAACSNTVLGQPARCTSLTGTRARSNGAP
jgi:hypothetical protein